MNRSIQLISNNSKSNYKLPKLTADISSGCVLTLTRGAWYSIDTENMWKAFDKDTNTINETTSLTVPGNTGFTLKTPAPMSIKGVKLLGYAPES